MEHTQPKQLAKWSHAQDAWVTETGGLFCEHLDVYSETFPVSGMTRNGTAYELPTWVPAITDSGFSSPRGQGKPGNQNWQDVPLFMTPMAAEAEKAVSGQSVAHRVEGGHQPWLTNQVMDLERERERASSALADANGQRLETCGLPSGRQQEKPNIDHSFPLLPTPAVNDMGAGKEIDAWDAWAARQKSASGRPAPHGKSLHIEALRMLPTPSANVGMNGGSQHPDKRRAGGHQPSIKDVVEHLQPTPKSSNNENKQSDGYGLNLGGALALLPTPRASDGTKGGPNQRGSKGDYMLPGAVHNLLPTPAVADTQGGRKSRSGSRSDELLLNGIAAYDTWGEYAPAIHRWESVFGVPAPDPTLPTGRDGKAQLSALFTEWMQGFPPGWNTDPDIWDGIRPSTARNQQLKQHGNAVNPPQLATVLHHVLTT